MLKTFDLVQFFFQTFKTSPALAAQRLKIKSAEIYQAVQRVLRRPCLVRTPGLYFWIQALHVSTWDCCAMQHSYRSTGLPLPRALPLHVS